MVDRDLILAPSQETHIEFALYQVPLLMHSLHLINVAKLNDGLDSWIVETANAMSEAEFADHLIASDSAYDLAHLPERKAPMDNFEAFIDFLHTVEPIAFRDAAIGWIAEADTSISLDDILENEETYINFLKEKITEKGKDFSEYEPKFRRMHHYLNHPAELRELTVNHLRMMWEKYVKSEWARVEPMLKESVTAHQQMDYTGLSTFEVMEAVTGRDVRAMEHITGIVNKVNHIIFIPSPHLGPYVGWHPFIEQKRAYIFFGARLPKGSTVLSPALSRSELLVRLNALADDTRLQMLKLLSEHGELCAQDFINKLDLSQSSASRHLRQLTASGYLTERRKEVAKCYTLNEDRLEDTVFALRQFLNIH